MSSPSKLVVTMVSVDTTIVGTVRSDKMISIAESEVQVAGKGVTATVALAVAETGGRNVPVFVITLISKGSSLHMNDQQTDLSSTQPARPHCLAVGLLSGS